MMTGELPEPIMVIPYETWKTFELTGEEGEFIVIEIVASWSKDYEKLFSIEQEVKCKTERYTNMIGGLGTGAIIPKKITQQFGVRLNHYIEGVLKKVIKDEQTIDVFPKREVFEHYPFGFDRKKVIERKT